MYKESFDATLTKTGDSFQDLEEISWARYLRVSSSATYHIGNAWLGCFVAKPALPGHESGFQCWVGFSHFDRTASFALGIVPSMSRQPWAPSMRKKP